ncbi:hypothetical protein TL16_g11853 [Triparma laevis f. inornata]|uniref:Uncharacterized protein n=2 Tax=Triparma laevis TaxID=1534972 RepID=A0A9W7L085_9STRA|nr:hypothetical protein TL16_g11853 [Triparma laevis f. inornata]GMI17511.1 hypothetical protein TrLO_g13100 [Triparma laevis f. longispina]
MQFGAVGSFELRYMGYDSFANDKASPVLLYLGNEGQIESFYNASGFLFELAQELEATVMFIEHRYYGESLPFGEVESFSNEGLRYLTIEQALADYSLFISALPDLIGCESRIENDSGLCDVVVFGGSYGGMLAAWHRWKYPHLTVGALASGAPIDFYPGTGIQGDFYDAFLHTYEISQENCGVELGSLLKAEYSVDDLKNNLKTCNSESATVEAFMFYVKGAVSSLAMIDYPYELNFIAPLPANPVEIGCGLIMTEGDEPIVKLRNLVDLYVNYTGDLECWDLDAELVAGGGGLVGSSDLLGVTSWNYQACTELVLEPITSDGFGFYPPDDGEETQRVVDRCLDMFNVTTRLEWMPLSFGTSKDYSKYLTNTILAENEKDPWHVGTQSVVENEANELYQLFAKGGAHHQDLRFTDDLDSAGVKEMRAKELDIIKKWLNVK